MSVGVQIPVRVPAFNSLGSIPKSGIYGSNDNSVFEETPNSFSPQWHHCTFPPAMHRISISPNSHQSIISFPPPLLSFLILSLSPSFLFSSLSLSFSFLHLPFLPSFFFFLSLLLSVASFISLKGYLRLILISISLTINDIEYLYL